MNPKIKVTLGDLSGPDGNVFMVFSKVKKALIREGKEVEAAPYLSMLATMTYKDIIAKIHIDFEVM